MEIQITAQRLTVSRVLRTFITDRLAAALEHLVAHIVDVHVEISDRNGRRGGGDKRCRILLLLKAGSLVQVEDVEANPRRAVLRAVSRAEAAVRRQLRLT